MAARWCLLMFLAAALAGCATGGDGVKVIEGPAETSTVHVADPEASRAPGTSTNGRPEGHLVGHVLDAAYTPIPGVEVRLPAFNLHDVTDRRGAFEFTDLPPGSYLFQADHEGHIAVETMLDITSGGPTRVRVILHALPPPEPYHETFKWAGFSSVTGFHAENVLSFTIWNDPWAVEPGPGAVHAAVLEATTEPHAAAPAASSGFVYRFDDADQSFHGRGAAPLRVQLDVADETPGGPYLLEVALQGHPVPEADKAFDVYLTLFHHGPPPEGWSVATT